MLTFYAFTNAGLLDALPFAHGLPILPAALPSPLLPFACYRARTRFHAYRTLLLFSLLYAPEPFLVPATLRGLYRAFHGYLCSGFGLRFPFYRSAFFAFLTSGCLCLGHMPRRLRVWLYAAPTLHPVRCPHCCQRGYLACPLVSGLSLHTFAFAGACGCANLFTKRAAMVAQHHRCLHARSLRTRTFWDQLPPYTFDVRIYAGVLKRSLDTSMRAGRGLNLDMRQDMPRFAIPAISPLRFSSFRLYVTDSFMPRIISTTTNTNGLPLRSFLDADTVSFGIFLRAFAPATHALTRLGAAVPAFVFHMRCAWCRLPPYRCLYLEPAFTLNAVRP